MFLWRRCVGVGLWNGLKPAFYQVVGRFGGRALERAAEWYPWWEPEKIHLLIVVLAINCRNRASTQFRALATKIGVPPVGSCELLPLPAIEFDTITPNAT